MKKSRAIAFLAVIAILVIAYFVGAGVSKADGVWKDAEYVKNTEFGTGEKTITVQVVAEGKRVNFTIHTDKKTVGEALIEHDLIAGEDGPYGLYVKYVNGIKADYDENKAYWAFSKDSKPLDTGVDKTKIADGEKYELIYTK